MENFYEDTVLLEQRIQALKSIRAPNAIQSKFLHLAENIQCVAYLACLRTLDKDYIKRIYRDAVSCNADAQNILTINGVFTYTDWKLLSENWGSDSSKKRVNYNPTQDERTLLVHEKRLGESIFDIRNLVGNDNVYSSFSDMYRKLGSQNFSSVLNLFAFCGTGHRLSDSPPTEVIQTVVVEQEINVDLNQPIVNVCVRFLDGNRHILKFNTTHTINNAYNIIRDNMRSQNITIDDFVIYTGYPPTKASLDLSMENMNNETIILKSS